MIYCEVERLLLVFIHKFLGSKHSMRESGGGEIPVEILIARIQQGDVKLRNQFITDYQPLVAKMASRFCKRYIDPAKDDEFSISLQAFNEAITQYSPKSGGTFFGFAEMVIRRRLIDHIRKETRHQNSVPYSSFDIEDEEQNVMNSVEIHESIERYETEVLRINRQHEIMEYAARLGEFGISFRELTEVSPKHRDSRQMMMTIGKGIAANESWMDSLLRRKLLPVKELCEGYPVSRKTIERNRRYIIAIALIAHGNYPHLQDYLRLTDEDGKEES